MVKFEYIASDGINYYVEADGYLERDEVEANMLITKVTGFDIYDEEGNRVNTTLDNDILDEIVDEIYYKDFQVE